MKDIELVGGRVGIQGKKKVYKNTSPAYCPIKANY
jgi:hypothetical protein